MGNFYQTVVAKSAEGAVVTHRCVTFGTAAHQVKAPAAANAAPAGVVVGGEGGVTVATGNTVDVAKGGIIEIEVGSDDVTAGKFVYLDADGCVNDLPAATVTAQDINAVGIAQAAAEDGELVEVEWAPCLIHIPATQ